MYLLDTSTCVRAMRGDPVTIASLSRISPRNCLISAISVFELEIGVRKCAVPAQEETRLKTFLALVTVADFQSDAAREAAMVRAELEYLGTPIGPYDTLIAGHARNLGATLVTENIKEFSRVAGLSVQTW